MSFTWCDRLDFSGISVVLLGDLVLDRFLFGTTVRVSREAPVPVIRYEGETLLPGGAANAAANLASLGGQVAVVGLVGMDAAGDQLCQLLQSTGVDLQGVVRSDRGSTITKTRVMAGGLGTVRQQVLRLDREPDEEIDRETQQKLTGHLDALRSHADVLVLSDYGYGAIRPEALDLGSGPPAVVDSRGQLRRFRGAHTLKPNHEELSQDAGGALHSTHAIDKAAQALRSASDADAVLVTLGRHGMRMAQSSGVQAIPAHGDAEVADVTGAGDSVLAAYTLAVGSGWSPHEAAELATVAGGIAVAHHGTHQVRIDEILVALDHD
ncbi:MAG: PfkB family carbohydrate kinase [Myxococcota bacterium]|nr:PfkB family carbohydrate kinase [Myxococcota bacterium]